MYQHESPLKSDLTESEKMWLEVEGPDPIQWPGEKFELIKDTPGFIHPEDAAKVLSATTEGESWKIDLPARPNVERIFTVKQESCPLELRARVAGSGAHQDADSIQFVVDIKYLLGTQERGVYQQAEIARGSFEEMKDVVQDLLPKLQMQFQDYCKFENDRPIISSLDQLSELVKR